MKKDTIFMHNFLSSFRIKKKAFSFKPSFVLLIFNLRSNELNPAHDPGVRGFWYCGYLFVCMTQWGPKSNAGCLVVIVCVAGLVNLQS